MDELQFAASQSECEALCDQARGFTCRAFTYAADEKRCYLSGDDSISLSNAPLTIKRGAVYAEKQCSISEYNGPTGPGFEYRSRPPLFFSSREQASYTLRLYGPFFLTS